MLIPFLDVGTLNVQKSVNIFTVAIYACTLATVDANVYSIATVVTVHSFVNSHTSLDSLYTH